MLITILAFIVAIVVLVAIHEMGHFWMARWCGVKVLCFSIGFGPSIKTMVSKKTGIEYKLAAIPLGGYVKMVDEREAAVRPEDLPFAFNRQKLYKRALIVFAGPAANLLLAVLLFAVIGWSGLWQTKAILSEPQTATVMAQAGLQSGDEIQKIGFSQDDLNRVNSFEDLRWWLTRAVMAQKNLWLAYERTAPESENQTISPLKSEGVAELGTSTLAISSVADGTVFKVAGLTVPYAQPVIEKVMAGGAAEKAGLKANDRVMFINEQKVPDAAALQRLIARGVKNGSAPKQMWEVMRHGQMEMVEVSPQVTHGADGEFIAKVGIYIGSEPQLVLVRYGFLEGIQKAAGRTWDLSALTLRSMWQMVVGSLSVKNISGPITIAEYAGKSAEMGWQAFFGFLAFISVSLGIVNLLPLPVLDGGHLVYYLWEGITGKPVSEMWMERLSRLGIALLILLMVVAFYNDFSRLLG